MTVVRQGSDNFRYNGQGQRAFKQTGTGVSTYYIGDVTGRTFAIVKSNNADPTFNLWGGDHLGQLIVTFGSGGGSSPGKSGTQTTLTRQDGRLYYLKDHLGTIRVTVNDAGDVSSYDDYYPFGMFMDGRSSNFGQTDARYKYTGKERDVETGLDYIGARYHDAKICRWISADPRAEKYLNWTSYNYSLDNPLRNVDPDGQEVKVYTERLGSTTMSNGGVGVFDNAKRAVAWVYGPRHSFLRVTTDKVDVILELGGPKEGRTKGTPLKTELKGEPGSRPDQEEHLVNRPQGVSETNYDGFENKILKIYNAIANNLPDYNAVDGPNSNGFIRFLIEAAGGGVDLPDHAWKIFFNTGRSIRRASKRKRRKKKTKKKE